MEQHNGVSYPDWSKIRDYLTRQTTTLSAQAAELTVLAAQAGYARDIYSITGSNSSNVALTYQVRDTTGGSTVTVLVFPASVTTTFTFNPPIKQTTKNTNWTMTGGTANAFSNTSIIFYICAANIPLG